MAVAIEQQQNKINPKLFALVIGIVAIFMLFASLTSAYIVRQGAGDWKSFKIPTIFWVNTVVILISSGTIQWAVNAHKKYNDAGYKLAMTLTTVLGAAFLVGQYLGWVALMNNGNYLDGNPAESFFYVIPGVHAVHILGGLLVLIVMTIRAYIKPFNPNKLIDVQLIATYWHFVDFLWIYLFIFLQIKFS